MSSGKRIKIADPRRLAGSVALQPKKSNVKENKSNGKRGKKISKASSEKRDDKKRKTNGKSTDRSTANSALNTASKKNSKPQRIATQTAKDQTLPKMDELKILSIDIGGTKVKMLVNGEVEPRKALSGPTLTPIRLVEIVNELTKGWKYDAVSIGYPGLIGPNGPISEPANLGSGWVGFDFSAAFGRPVKLVNDAAMQAIGNYEGGRMLFLGFGTGLGSTLIADNVIIPLELNNLRWNANYTIGEVTGRAALKRFGVKKWRVIVNEVLESLIRSFLTDYIVVGGGNAKFLDQIPTGARRGHNQTAFRGGYRVWGLDSIPTHAPDSMSDISDWRLI